MDMYKIINFPMYTISKFTGFLKKLKEDEKGLSGVVVAILLILVSVLAVVMIWGFLSGWLSTVWDNITGQAGSIS